MINLVVNNALHFFALILLQGLVLNNIMMGGYINPYLYIMFILLLPFETPGWLVMTLGFITGLSIDMFTGTIGLHVSATVFLGFMRIVVLNLMKPREGYEFGLEPRVSDMGWQWFAIYALVLTVAHHLWLFQVEVFRFNAIPQAMLKTILSSIFTLVLIYLIQLFWYRRKKKTRA